MIHVLLAVALMQFPPGVEVAYVGGHQPELCPEKDKYQITLTPCEKRVQQERVALMQSQAGITTVNGSVTARPFVQPAPLKCGKYQHLVKAHADCLASGDSHHGTCEYYPGVCADDLHTVTEKEWQELQGRLRVDQYEIQRLIDQVNRLAGR